MVIVVVAVTAKQPDVGGIELVIVYMPGVDVCKFITPVIESITNKGEVQLKIPATAPVPNVGEGLLAVVWQYGLPA